MKSFLAKINRGLILTVAVLLAVVIYLLGLAAEHRADKPDIKKICEDYIQTAANYSMLPQSYRKDKPDIPQSDLDSYFTEMTKALSAYYPDSKQTALAASQLKTSLQSQAKGKDVIFDYKKDIVEFKSYAFDGHLVTVSIQTNSSLDENSTTSSALGRSTVTSKTTDTLTLQKISGKWKVVYADLPQPSNNAHSKEEYYSYGG